MLEVRNLNVSFPGFALRDINLSINKGEFFALLGPTGSGKTVLLETIAGLKAPARGQIFFDGRDVTALKPEQRNISIVYQDYALFPHLNVQQNIRYGLRFKKNGGSGQPEKFNLLIEMLGIAHLLMRYPGNLSGGEKQRVALARALIVEPDILLLDEPFSALDANTKETVQSEIKALHGVLKTTTLMVTHNFSEVFSLAERVAIIKEGAVQQVGSTQDVFKTPRSKFVAEFVGMKNVFSLHQTNGKVALGDLLELDLRELGGPDLYRQKNTGNGGREYYIGLRPEDIILGKQNLQTDYQIQGIVTTVSNNGVYSEVRVRAGRLNFTAYLTPNRYFELGLRENKPVYLGFDRKNISLIMEKAKDA